MQSSYLVCRFRGHLCALPIAHVIETMRPLPVEPFSGAPSCVLGVSLVRGNPTPIVDIGALLSPEHQTMPTRFITLRAGKRRVSVVADQVVGIRSIPSSSLAASPPLLRRAAEDAISELGALDRELLVVLEVAKLVPEPVWKALEDETTV